MPQTTQTSVQQAHTIGTLSDGREVTTEYAARVTVLSEAELEFREACKNLEAAKQRYHAAPNEENLRAFCGALRIAEDKTARLLRLEDLISTKEAA